MNRLYYVLIFSSFRLASTAKKYMKNGRTEKVKWMKRNDEYLCKTSLYFTSISVILLRRSEQIKSNRNQDIIKTLVLFVRNHLSNKTVVNIMLSGKIYEGYFITGHLLWYALVTAMWTGHLILILP